MTTERRGIMDMMNTLGCCKGDDSEDRDPECSIRRQAKLEAVDGGFGLD